MGDCDGCVSPPLAAVAAKRTLRPIQAHAIVVLSLPLAGNEDEDAAEDFWRKLCDGC